MDEKILREILTVTKENNEILRSINLHRKWLTFYTVLKWTLIVILAYGAYTAATPYIEQAQATIDGLNNLNNQAKELQNIDQKNFTDFLKNEIQKRLNP